MVRYPLVSVVLTTWNRRAELELTLYELTKQEYPNSEVIVVDNHSTDGTVEMVRERFPQVRLIVMPAPSYGPCESMNIGFANALGEYILALDDDSYPVAGGIEKAISKFLENPKLAALGFNITLTDAGVPWDVWPSDVLSHGTAQTGYLVPWAIGCGVLYRSEVLKEVGYYQAEYYTYGNEIEIGARILNAGYEIRFFPEIIVHHRLAQGGRKSGRALYFFLRNLIWFNWQYMPLAEALGNTAFMLGFYLLRSFRDGHLPYYLRAVCDGLGGVPAHVRRRTPLKPEVLGVVKSNRFLPSLTRWTDRLW